MTIEVHNIKEINIVKEVNMMIEVKIIKEVKLSCVMCFVFVYTEIFSAIVI